MSVIVYTTPTCGYCKMAKSYLHANKVEFSEVDITTDQAGLKWVLDRTGQAAVPVLNIGETVILGFDRPEIDAALKSNNLL